MWSTSLASHQKTFQQLASQVSVWDRQLVENSSKISTLYGRCFQAERDCAEVERQLSSVEQGQVELEAALERYEQELDSMGGLDGMGGDGGVEGERERTYVFPFHKSSNTLAFVLTRSPSSYQTAESCSTRLSTMSHSLTTMIEEINLASTNLAPATNATAKDDPLAQIVRVLNGHLTQLQSIDLGAADLQGRVEQAKAEARTLGQSQGVGSQGWVEGFGRSYLGR